MEILGHKNLKQVWADPPTFEGDAVFVIMTPQWIGLYAEGEIDGFFANLMNRIDEFPDVIPLHVKLAGETQLTPCAVKFKTPESGDTEIFSDYEIISNLTKRVVHKGVVRVPL